MTHHPFVEEIDYKEIKLEGIVGKGAFGTVKKGKWRDLDVAVKVIETEQEKKAFIIELKQLSRVKHPNIVKLYGACTKTPVCLIMEYAEGGSLYNVLHCMKQVEYTAAHAISWLLQCAKGVAYLHNMKPRALIHRDLKPPNLLLVMGGTVLKICDFGTACDMHTNMTNTKGSAAWMAPEVFEGSQYSEKCDIFSWAIILWEVLTRRKPFHDVGVTAFCIMWTVYNGRRPPLIQGCPKPLESLMTRCWEKNPMARPSMSEVEKELSEIFKFFKGADKPITYLSPEAASSASTEDIPTSSNSPKDQTGNSESKTVLPKEDLIQKSVGQLQLITNRGNHSFSEDSFSSGKIKDDVMKRRSADFSSIEIKQPSRLGHRRYGSDDSSYINPSIDIPGGNSSEKLNVAKPEAKPVDQGCNKEEEELKYNNAYLLLEPKLQPLAPARNCNESVEIFENHRRMAQEYIQVQTEITLLVDRRNELQKQLKDQDYTNSCIEEYIRLKEEKESLLTLRQNLKQQLEIIKSQQQKQQQCNVNNNNQTNSDDWVLVETHS